MAKRKRYIRYNDHEDDHLELEQDDSNMVTQLTEIDDVKPSMHIMEEVPPERCSHQKQKESQF